MIVKNGWQTKKELPKYYQFKGVYVSSRTKQWVGYFLFGFIPLYIKCVEITYHP